MVEALIGLGSNLGDRQMHLHLALGKLRGLGSVEAVSSIYETAPIGGPPQDPYLNMVVALETDLGPRPLLEAILRIEEDAGRVRSGRWGPRTLDLDLLLHGDVVVDEPGLRVPHPRMTMRRFVLEPLLEIRPRAKTPDGRNLKQYLKDVAGQEVRRLTP